MKLMAQIPPVIVAAGNPKGGTGKTNISVNLACQLQQIANDMAEVWQALEGRKTLPLSVAVIDADPLGSASYWASKGTLSVPVESIEVPTERALRSLVRRVMSRKPDCVVIDTPAQHKKLIALSFELAHVVLIPVTASKADVPSTIATLEMVEAARVNRRDVGPKCLLVPNIIDPCTVVGRQIEPNLMQLGVSIAPVIQRRVAFVNASGAHLWIGEYQPFGPAHADIQKLAHTLECDTIRRSEVRDPPGRSKVFPSWLALGQRVATLFSSEDRARAGRSGPQKESRHFSVRPPEKGTLSWTSPKGVVYTQRVEMGNLPGTGPRVKLTTPLPVGQTVRIMVPPEKNFKGIVEYCRETRAILVEFAGDGYDVDKSIQVAKELKKFAD